jgi:hypothetical protein
MENFELIARIKHESGSKLLSIASTLRNIEKVMEAKGLSETLINEKYDLTIQDSIGTAMASLEDLHLIFKKYERLTDEA